MTSLIASGAVFCLIFLLTGLYNFWYSIDRLRQKEDKECMKRDRVFVCEKVKIKGKEYYLYCDSVEITYCEETDPYDIGADNVVIDIKEIEFEDEDVYVKDVETKEIFYFGDSIFDKDTWEDLAVWVNDYVEEGDFEYKYL